MRITPYVVATLVAVCVASVSVSVANAHPQGAHSKNVGNQADVRAVKDVVERAYIQAVHVDRDFTAMRAGFHPDFVMFIRSDDNTMRQMTLDSWIERMSANPKAKEKRPKVRHRFLMADVTGDSAVVKVAVYKDDVHVFTDYMSLYRFAEGWRIVGKSFQSHRG